MRLSRRTTDLALSVTLALDARAKELIAAGHDVVNMAVGEPDFPAPAAARQAAIAKIQSLDVRYTSAAGTLTLREAIAEHLAATRSTHYTSDQIVVCHSGKQAISGALAAVLEPGDEVLVPTPGWVSYVEIARALGNPAVEVPGHPDGAPSLEALEQAISERTRAILINSPCNPTGHVWSRVDLQRLAALAERHNLWIVSDEIYRRLVYGERPFTSPVSLGPEARARTIIVDGASKSFAMTGYRIGFAAGPKEAIRAITKLHSQMTGSPNAVSQAAYEAVLREEPPEVAQMVETYRERRALMIAGLQQLGLQAPFPHGAFYAFPDVSVHLGDETSSDALCRALLEDEQLVCVPGSAFGTPTHIRLSYALDIERLREAFVRLGRFLGKA